MDNENTKMKRLWKIILFLLCMGVLFTACQKQENAIEREAQTEENSVASSEVKDDTVLYAEESLLYETYITQLDQLLDASKKREQECAHYTEELYSIYLFSEAYHGGLQADYDADGIAAVHMMLSYGEEGEDTDDKQKYHLRLLEDGSFWITYQAAYEENYDLPDYVVNEDVLRYSRTDYAYDDGRMDLEEKKAEKTRKVTEYLEEPFGGEEAEYWYFQDKVYQVDRENKRLIDVTKDQAVLIVSFLLQQPDRIFCQLKVKETVITEVEKWKPKGYSCLNGWNNIAVSDLNEDGLDDYVLALYPDDYENVQRYEDFSPYEKLPQYYAASFWLLLSNEEKEYEQIQLSDTVEYRVDNTLNLVEVSFARDKVLQIEYFIGRSPFLDAVIQFEYDEEQKDFYIDRSYFRDYIGLNYYVLLVGDEKNYGRTNLHSYLAYNQRYNEEKWKSADDIKLNDKAVLGYYSDHFQYGSANLLEENHMNSLIWQTEYEVAQKLVEKYSDMELRFSLTSDPLYYNENIVSGNAAIYGNAVSENTEHDIEQIHIPIMMDRNSGEYLNVIDLIEQDAFLTIFTNWASDVRNQSELSTGERMLCENAIKSYWKEADSVEQYVGDPKEILYLQIVSEGVMLGVWGEENWMEYFVIDKEYFLDTQLWQYLKPEWS